jgi:hypothetical protein
MGAPASDVVAPASSPALDVDVDADGTQAVIKSTSPTSKLNNFHSRFIFLLDSIVKGMGIEL